MRLLDLSPAEREFVADRVRRFEQDAAPTMRWQAAYVAEHQALPLFLGWLETIGLRAGGELVRWSTEGDWAGTRPVTEQLWINTALVQGAARYPELRRLIPSRPPDAHTCSQCGGTGRIRGLPAHADTPICQCGGIGWLLRPEDDLHAGTA